MRNLKFIFLIIPFAVMAQVGVSTTAIQPTEDLHVNGTLRVSGAPNNGDTNAIFTDSSGNASLNQDQTFTATKVVVADTNGVLGTMDGLPKISDPNAAPVRAAFNSTKIESGSQTNSILTVDKLSVRFDGESPNGTQETISIRLNGVDDKVIVNQWRILQGSGGTSGDGRRGGQQQIDNLIAGNWKVIGVQGTNTMTLDVTDNQFAQYNISLIKTKEVYRVSVDLNTTITAPTGSDINSDAVVTIFIEKLGI